MEESKKKVAKLVTFEITTRVIVNDSEMPEITEEDAINAALVKIGQKTELCYDNLSEICNDFECPFGTFTEDLSANLHQNLLTLSQMCSNFMYMQPEAVNSYVIVSYGATILMNNLDELASIEGAFEPIYETLTKCVYYMNKDFDHEVSDDEYEEIGYELVEKLSGILGEFFV